MPNNLCGGVHRVITGAKKKPMALESLCISLGAAETGNGHFVGGTHRWLRSRGTGWLLREVQHVPNECEGDPHEAFHAEFASAADEFGSFEIGMRT